MFEGGKGEMGCVVGLEVDELRERVAREVAWELIRGLCIFGTHSVHGVLQGLWGNETGSWRLGWMGCLGGGFATADLSDVHFI